MIIVLIAALLTGSYLYYKYRVAPAIAFPELELTDLEGNPVSLADVKGQHLFVSFFATWCGPCIQEIPLLENVRRELAGYDFVFVLVSDESLPKLKRFAAYAGTSIRILHSNQKLKDLGIHSVPTSYLVDANGKTVQEWTGSFDPKQGAVGIANEFRMLVR